MISRRDIDSLQLPLPFSSPFNPVLPGIPRLSRFRDICQFPFKCVYDYHKAKHGFFSPSRHCRYGRVVMP